MAGRSRDIQLALLDHRLPMGVLILDATGKVLSQNTVARDTLDARDGLSLQQGRVVAAKPAESAKLHDVVHEVCRRAERAAEVTGRALRVSRPSGRPAFHLFVAPLRPWESSGRTNRPERFSSSRIPDTPWRHGGRCFAHTA